MFPGRRALDGYSYENGLMGKDFQEKGSEGSRIGQRIKAKQWCGFRHGQASA